MDLNEQADRATEMLKGKVVAKVMRHHAKEICIEFTDGTRLFIDQQPNNLELSISGDDKE